ncbi:hypothetical protein KEM52_006688 [Ascosphaera acerosa]|nr:hypothetical protein KEM52_006688 [Ascosphaera acerosa]
MQYRSPEMVDFYRGDAIDEKSDIWALGVFLYKLCYYTTPFEDVGQAAILKASFKFPAYPPFSDRLKLLVAEMLQADPGRRPDIYRVLQDSCRMRGKECPVPDVSILSNQWNEPLLTRITPQIHTARSQSSSRLLVVDTPATAALQPTAATSATAAASAPGAHFTPPIHETPIVPESARESRGRTSKPAYQSHTSAHHVSPHANARPVRGDGALAAPLTAPTSSAIGKLSPHAFGLLSRKSRKDIAEDELSAKYPSLEEFSLYLDNAAATPSPSQHPVRALTASKSTSDLAKGPVDLTRQVTTHIASHSPSPVRHQEKAARSVSRPPARPVMVSTGTMTSPPASPSPEDRRQQSLPRPHARETAKTAHKSRSRSRLGLRVSPHSDAAHSSLQKRVSPPQGPDGLHIQERDSSKGPSNLSRHPSSSAEERDRTRERERAQLSSGQLPPRPSSKSGTADKDTSHDGSNSTNIGSTSNSGTSDRRSSREFLRSGLFSRKSSRSSRHHHHHPSTHGNAAKLVDYEKEEATIPALEARASLDISRPSLDSYRPMAGRTTSAAWATNSSSSKQRPTSMYLSARDQLSDSHPRASLDSSLARPSRHELELDDVLSSPATAGYDGGAHLHKSRSDSAGKAADHVNLEEEVIAEPPCRGKHHHHKRGSITSLSISGAKKIMSGRFGDAFRRFEAGNGQSHGTGIGSGLKSKQYDDSEETDSVASTGAMQDMLTVTTTRPPALSTIMSTGLSQDESMVEPRRLNPDTSSSRPIAKHAKTLDYDSLRDEDLEQLTDDSTLSPEVRREIERRRLLLEEKRVAAAAAEYRQRLNQQSHPQSPHTSAGRSGRARGASGTHANAAMIQNKVQSLLRNENRRPVVRTATGYGRYTNVEGAGAALAADDNIPSNHGDDTFIADTRMSQSARMSDRQGAVSSREPQPQQPPLKPPRPAPTQVDKSPAPSLPHRPLSTQQSPVHLRSAETLSNDQVHRLTAQPYAAVKPVAPPKPQLLRTAPPASAQTQALSPITDLQHTNPPSPLDTGPDSPDWEAKFNQKYPSLPGIGVDGGSKTP